ncbi:MAG TPA: hypothetical protein VNN73_20000 [Blastocatellia bacterium]|nr:hypothetical protein [Blastocatellia bacterium]
MLALFGKSRIVNNGRLDAAVGRECRQGILASRSKHRRITPVGIGDELLKRLMLGLDVIWSQLRGNRLDTFTFDGQQEPSAVVSQGVSAVGVIYCICQQGQELIESLLAS